MPVEPLEDRIAPATFMVTSLADSGAGTLRAALDDSNDAGGANIVQFSSHLPHTGSIDLKTPLTISTSTSVAVSTGQHFTINGRGLTQLLYIAPNATEVTIASLTFTKGSGLATASVALGVNQAGGGAMLINDPGGSITIAGCTFSHNTAAGAPSNGGNGYMGQGGAVDLIAGNLTIKESRVTGNIARGGAAPFAYTGGVAMGGAIYVGPSGALAIQSSIITGNKAIGGAGLAGAKGAAGAKGSAGQAGGAGSSGGNGGYGGNAYGGAIFSYGSVIDLVSTISGNSAIGGAGGAGGAGGNGGAGGRAPGGNAGSGGSGGFSGNGIGGGILSGLANQPASAQATLSIERSTISGNIAAPGIAGAAGKAGKAGSGSPRGMAGTAGTAGATGVSLGGGIYTYGSYLSLVESTIAKNSAQRGGGLYLNQNIPSYIDNSTIAFNKGLVQGGGLFTVPDGNDDPITIVSTILGQNISPVNSDVAGIITADYSLIQNPGNAAITGTSNIIGQSALLGGLGNHGGPTQTALPARDSPVIGTGIVPVTVVLPVDQRGDARTTDGMVDIGADQVG